MIKKLVTITALAMLLGSSGSYAGFRSGNNLANDCKNDDDEFSDGVCYGYVMAVTDLMLWVNPNVKLCAPSEATGGQVVAIVRKFLEEHPEMLHQDAELLVMGALLKAFPCPE